MVRYFVTHQDVSYDCGKVTVHMRTGSNVHLWLLYTTIPPFVRPRPFRGQESERPHQNNFSLQIQGDIEQLEPGDTFTHTFVVKWPFGAQQLFFYTINVSTGGIKATRSPLFAYELTYTPLIAETWATPGKPDYEWAYNGSGLFFDFHSGQGKAVLPYTRQAPASLTSFFPSQTRVSSTALCNMVMTVEIFGWPQPLFGQAAEWLTQVISRNDNFDTQSRILAAARNYDACAAGDRNIVQFVGSPGTHRINIGQADADQQGACDNGMDPEIPDPYFGEVIFVWSSPGPAPTTEPLFVTIGPVRIYSTAGALTDISGQWKHKRIAPFIP